MTRRGEPSLHSAHREKGWWGEGGGAGRGVKGESEGDSNDAIKPLIIGRENGSRGKFALRLRKDSQ